MPEHEPLRALWRKSSHSGSTGGECVQVAGLGSDRAVRDSKNPDGGTLTFSRTEWNTFATRVKRGLLDL